MPCISAKRIIKNCFSSILFYSGLWRPLKYIRFNGNALILMYHRIIDDNSTERIQPGMFVTRTTFKKHIHFLKKYFEIISLSELVTLLDNKKDVTGKCVVTFDDGWRDNHTIAFPILLEKNFPATIFLVSDFIGRFKKMWTDEVYNNLISTYENSGPQSFTNLIYKYLPQVKLTPEYPSDEILEYIIDQLKKNSETKRIKFINELNSLQKPKSKLVRYFLNKEEILEMRDNNIFFGSHSVSHKILPEYNSDEIDAELISSKEILSDLLNYNVDYFCYPNGSYSEDIIHLVKKNEYKAACSTIKGYVNNSVDRFLLPRIGIHDDISNTLPKFVSRILMIPGF